MVAWTHAIFSQTQLVTNQKLLTGMRQKAKEAIYWNVGFSLFRDALQFFLTVILARLLTPSEYGQFGLVTSVIALLHVFSFRSFIAHTLQVQEEELTNYSMHFLVGGVIQIMLFMLTNLLAVGLRFFSTYASISPLLHVMSIIFLLDLGTELKVKMLEREINWKRLRLLHGIGLIVNAVVSVSMALAGAGVYALLVPTLFIAFPFWFDLLIGDRWRPKFEWHWHSYREAFRFGLARIGSGLVIHGRQVLESSLLIKWIGFGTYGLYNRAIGLSQLICYKFAFLLMQSIYPILASKLQTVKSSELVLRTVAWVVIPATIITATLSDPIINLIYGKQWIQAIPLVPFAMFLGAGNALAHTAYMLHLSRNRQNQCFFSDCLLLTGMALCLFWLLPHGLTFYITGVAIVQLSIFLLIAYWLHRAKITPFGATIRAIYPSAIAGSLSWILCQGIRNVLPPAASLANAILYLLVFVFLYLLVLRTCFPQKLKELLFYLPASDLLQRSMLFKTKPVKDSYTCPSL